MCLLTNGPSRSPYVGEQNLVTVVIPSYNQGRFLGKAIESVLVQDVGVELFVMDGGSTDESKAIISDFSHALTGWRSHKDAGQAAAINEGIQMGTAPYVCWLNSDDFFYEGALKQLVKALEENSGTGFAYGKCWTACAGGKRLAPYLTLQFRPWVFANFCSICQPGTLIRRSAWEATHGLNRDLELAMDYDFWWRLYLQFGPPVYVRSFVAATRAHAATKTATRSRQHAEESAAVVESYFGRLPLKWRIERSFRRRFKHS